MKIIQEILNKKYVQVGLFLFFIELLGSFYLKGYYFHFFQLDLFTSIKTEKELFYFYQTMKHLIGNVDIDNLLILNMIDPQHYLIRIIPCKNNISKIILLPQTIDIMNLIGTNLRGCYVIETYFCNDPILQKKVETLFSLVVEENKYLYKMNENKLTDTYEIVMRINDKHYKWINFIRILSFYEMLNTSLDYTNTELAHWIKNKMFFSAQSITLFILHRSINFYYAMISIFMK